MRKRFVSTIDIRGQRVEFKPIQGLAELVVELFRTADSSDRPSDRMLTAPSIDLIDSPDKIDLRNLTFEFIIFI